MDIGHSLLDIGHSYLAAYAGVKNFDPTTDTSPEPTIGHWTFLVGHWTLIVRNVQCPIRNVQCPSGDSTWRLMLESKTLIRQQILARSPFGHWTFLVGHWTLLVRNVQCPRGVLSWGLVVAYCHKVNFQGGAGLEISCCLLL